MSWVMPPGIAPRARSASAAERGCVARYCSWVVMAPMITLASALRRDGEQRYQRRVHVKRQAFNRGRTAPRPTVARARRNTRANDPSLLIGRVQQRAAGEPSEVRRDPVRAPVRNTGDDQMIDAHDRRDAFGERGPARESRVHIAHSDLVAAIPNADSNHTFRRPFEWIFVVA